MTNALPIPLDMFTDIIAVHWPDNEITKLDFVGDRYMVRNKDQELIDVLGVDFPDNFIELTAEEQRLLRGPEGLNLIKEQSDGTLNFLPYKAWLKNKYLEPDKKHPGALNEFLRFNYTMVMEYDSIDFSSRIVSEGNAPDDSGSVDLWFDLIAVEQREDLSGYAPGLRLTTTSRFYATEEATIDTVDAVWHYNILAGPGTAEGESGDPFRYLVQAEMQVLSGSIPPGYVPQEPTWGRAPFLIAIVPANENIDFFESEPGTAYRPTASVALNERAGSAIEGRVIGAAPDDGTYIDGFSSRALTGAAGGGLQSPYGRNRIAFTVTSEKMVVAINGNEPFYLKAPSPLLTMPRPYPEDGSGGRLTYYPIEYIHEGFSNTAHQNLEVFFSSHIKVRCVWLYRKPKTDKKLKGLSTVKPLTPPDSPKWKTT